MNSFIENVNYVAGLDNLYGSGIELYKNNLSLKSVQHDIELKFSYYNNDDKKIHSIVHSEPGVLVGGINDTLLSFKTLVESSITGSEFTCVVNFVINNIVMVNINIVSNSDMYKTYELEMKIVTAGVVTYDVFGEVKDSLKILPSLAMITASDVDVMANAYEIREEVVTVAGNIVGLNSIVSNMTEILLADDNAAIATAKALESSDSAAASLQSALDSAASAALFPDHIADITNPHEVTKSQVGLEFAENTADADKIVASAGKLTAARDISLSGEVSGTVTFDGSANVDMAVSISGLDASKLVSGVIDADRLPGYIYEAQPDKVLVDVNKIALSLDSGISVVAGELAWNADEVTMDLGLGTAVVQVGQELLIRIRNGSGSTIANGTVVMAIDSIGNSGRIVVGPHDGTKANADRVVGIMTEELANGFDGFATIIGKVRTINTTGTSVGETWVDGTKLYVKPNDAGNLTMVEPLDNEVKMAVAYVVKAHNAGTLYVRVTGVDTNEFKEWVNTQLLDKVDVSVLTGLNVFRADKVLASKDVANMIYSAGNLVKIRYTTDVDVDYEVLTYSGSDLVNVAHYVDSVFKGDTVLTYSGGELVSSIFVGV